MKRDTPATLREFPNTLGWGPSVTDPTWVDWYGWWGYFNYESHVESPAAPRGRDVFHRPDRAITCTERYTDPEYPDCYFDGLHSLLSSGAHAVQPARGSSTLFVRGRCTSRTGQGSLTAATDGAAHQVPGSRSSSGSLSSPTRR